MATLCNMEILAVGRDVAAVEGVGGRRDAGVVSARPQRVVVSAMVEKRWPSARVVAQQVSGVRFRCNATSGDGQNKKNYDINEVVEKIVSDEENQLPEEKKTPEPLPEGEPSPFSPAIDTDDTEAFQGEGVSKDSMIEPPRGMQVGGASASIGEGLGASEQSALAADIGGSPNSGPGVHGRDWRVQSFKGGRSATGSNVRVEKAVDTEAPETDVWSESSVL